jgi:hypothetical protein
MKSGIENVPLGVRIQIEASQMNFAGGIELSIEILIDKVVDQMKSCLMDIQTFNEVRLKNWGN